MRPHLASLVDDFRAHAKETAIVAHRGVRRYRTTYGELADLAGRFSAELARRGIGPGERVVLWGANSAEWVAVFFGCLLRGVIAVPLDAAGSAEFAARVIADVKPKLVVGDVERFEERGSGFGGGGVRSPLSVVRSHVAEGGGSSERDKYGDSGASLQNDGTTNDGTTEGGGAVPLIAQGRAIDGARMGEGSDDPARRGEGSGETAMMALRGIAEQLAEEPRFDVDAAVGLDAAFQIVFTSGTTAEPRGIVHTHRNILVTLDPIEREIAKYRRFERPFHPLRFLHSLPLSHVFGQFMGLWTPALLGAEVHFAEQLDPSRIADVIRRDRVSVLVAVPRVLHLLRAHLVATVPGLADGDRSTLSVGRSTLRTTAATSTGNKQRITDNMPPMHNGLTAVLRKWWRFRGVHRALGWKFWAIISGGATLPADLEAFYNKIGLALIQGYGMTETAALVTLNHPFHIAPGTIGKTLPGREVKIGDDGEILVRGAMLSGATWQHGAMHAREGEWLTTGDLAEETASGELKFVGRKGDVIVTGAGLNIHPADLEEALAAQPGIRAAAVVACEFAAGPEPVAVVLTALDGAQLDAAVAAANRTLAEFQQMRRVLRWPEPQFPYTSTGKLVRRKVAEWACGEIRGTSPTSLQDVGHPADGGGAFPPKQSLGGAPSLGSVVRSPFSVVRPQDWRNQGLSGGKDALLALIAEASGEPAPKVSDANALRLSEDLHLDSLGRVQLQSAIEQRFAIDVDDDAMAAVGTVGELRGLLEGVERSPLSVDRFQARGERSKSQASLQAEQGEMDRAHAPTENVQRTTENESPAFSTRNENIYPRWAWTWPVRMARIAFIEMAMRPVVWLLAKPRVVYEPGAREALEKAFTAKNGERRTHNEQPLLLIANHITAYDGALALYALPGPLRRRVAAAMSGEMLRDYRDMRNQGAWILNLLAPTAYWLLTALFNVFPLPRDRGFRRSFAHAGEAMDRGYSVLIFPEGTRSLTGHMNRFRSGIGLLARDTEAPVLPVALRGVYELVAERGMAAPRLSAKSALGTRARWFHAGRIEIRVGVPIAAAELSACEPAALAARLEDALRNLVEPEQPASVTTA